MSLLKEHAQMNRGAVLSYLNRTVGTQGGWIADKLEGTRELSPGRGHFLQHNCLLLSLLVHVTKWREQGNSGLH